MEVSSKARYCSPCSVKVRVAVKMKAKDVWRGAGEKGPRSVYRYGRYGLSRDG
jgi:hypothetical protein